MPHMPSSVSRFFGRTPVAPMPAPTAPTSSAVNPEDFAALAADPEAFRAAPANRPAPVVTSIVTAPAASALSAVDKALANLVRKDNVEALWTEKVTSRTNLIMKLFGIVAYKWGKSAALKQDQLSIDFKNKCTALVNAVYARDVSPAERGATMGEGRPSIIQTLAEADASLYAECQAEKKLNEFYATFKLRVKALNGDSNGDLHAAYTLAAQKLISEVGMKKAQLKADSKESEFLISKKIPTTLNVFAKKVFDDVLLTFAQKPLKDITPEGFKATVALLKQIFGKIKTIAIETELRQAILQNKDSSEFAMIINDHTKKELVEAKIAELVSSKKSGSEQEIARLEQELIDICGPNGHDGYWHIASVAVTAAKEAVEAANQAVNNERRASIGNTLADRSTAENLSIPVGPSLVNLQRLQEALTLKQEELVAAEAKVANFKARYDQINGGELEKLRKNVNKSQFETAARREVLQLQKFYTELAAEYTDEFDIKARSIALHDIID